MSLRNKHKNTFTGIKSDVPGGDVVGHHALEVRFKILTQIKGGVSVIC